MRRAGMWREVVCGAVIGLSAIACADSDRKQIERLDNTPPVVGSPTPPPSSVSDLTTGETVKIPGVSADVTVVIDHRGIPHIYGKKITDVLQAEGYIMARDRFPQMEFIRRSVTGTLTEVLAPVVGREKTLSQDQQALFFGFARIAKQVYDGLPADDVVKVYTDAYVAGVNTYIAEIAAEAAKGASANLSRFVPQGDNLFYAILSSPYFRPWTSADVLAIARFQAFDLSFDETDLGRTAAQFGLADFNAGSDPRFSELLTALIDMTTPAPARAVYTTDAGGPGAVAVGPAHTAPAPVSYAAATTASVPAFNPATVQGMRAFVQSVQDLKSILGNKERGSNDWVVSGAHTASGAAMLANDPHLSLTSPPVWYYAHLVASDDGIDAEGVSFAGLPGITLGFTKDIAWGATTTTYDVTDFYLFGDSSSMTIDGTGALTATPLVGSAITVAPSALEVIHDPTGTDVQIPIYVLPDYGQVIFNGTAPLGITVRTTNSELSNEFGFFLRLLTAKTIADARSAQATYFKVGAQNFVFATATGDISWQTYARVPVRPSSALGWDGLTPSNPTDPASSNHCPIFVLPAAANFTWTGAYTDTDLPALLDPAKGWIATANQDPIGVTKDGNPCNDGIYLGGTFDPGYREFRIAQKLDSLSQRGGITAADLQDIQATSKSSLGETTRTPIVASLDRSIASGTYDAATVTLLTNVRNRLNAWTLATPPATDTADAAVIADSIATTLFNVGITRIIALAFGDEQKHLARGAAQEGGVFDPLAAPLLERALLAAPSTASADNSQGLVSYNATLGDTLLWDNLDTTEIETRDPIIAQAFIAAVAALKVRLGPDEGQWLWGRLHTVTFETLVPATGLDVQSIPSAADPLYVNGFPRHSDWGAVDVGNFDLWQASVSDANGLNMLKTSIGLKDFSYGTGPSQRFVVEMLPSGPVAYNAIPGGQSGDPNSPHHADEAALWVANKAPQLNYAEADVAANAELKIVISAQ